MVNRTLVQLHDNGEASIFLQLTVPFGCPKDRYGKTLLRCSLDVTVFMPDKKICQQNDIALKMKNNFGCGVRIYNDEVGKPTELRLQGRHLQGNIQPQGRHLVARLTTQGQYKAHKLFEKYYLEPVSVSEFWCHLRIRTLP